MQSLYICELCGDKEMEETFEANCCQRKYCKFCVAHLKAESTGNCHACNLKLSFSKLISSGNPSQFNANSIVLKTFKEKQEQALILTLIE